MRKTLLLSACLVMMVISFAFAYGHARDKTKTQPAVIVASSAAEAAIDVNLERIDAAEPARDVIAAATSLQSKHQSSVCIDVRAKARDVSKPFTEGQLIAIDAGRIDAKPKPAVATGFVFRL